ncbi:MAG: outer membrane beta-barrel protein [Cytophagales bacterium]|nr:outer membrane beta-barrel protein [Cytophagales bacterium]
MAAGSIHAQKQYRFGIKLYPALAWSRVSPEVWADAAGIRYEYTGSGTKLRGGLGFVFDYYLSDNFVFGTGLNYYHHGSGYGIVTITSTINNTINNNYTMQVIQLPLTAKFISNEVADRLKITVGAGFALDYMTGASNNDKSNYQKTNGGQIIYYSQDINNFNLNFTFAPGVEYELGGDFIIFTSILYGRGLLDANHGSTGIANDKNNFTWHNDYIAWEFGVKF